MEDAALLAAFVTDKSQEAFQELVRRHIGVVYSVCRRQLRDDHWAEDVTQAVFILLARKAPQISSKVVLGGWLYKAAYFACSNARDMKKTRAYHETRVTPMNIPEEENPVERAEMEGLLDEALMELNKSQREVLVLRFFENKTLAEVAKSRRQSLYSTQKALDAGLARLRTFLSKKGVTVSAAIVAGLMVQESAKAVPAGLATSVGAGALTPASAVPAQIADLVTRLAAHGVRTKLINSFAGVAACLLLGLAGLAFGQNFIHAPVSGSAVTAEEALSPEQQTKEVASLWKTLHETEDALRRMDTAALQRLVSLPDPMQLQQWNAMARVFGADLALKESAAARFGPEGKRMTAIATFGDRLDAVIPQIDSESARWHVTSGYSSLHFGYRDAALPGSALFFIKVDGRWKIDADRSVEISLEGLNDEQKRDNLDRLTVDQQNLVWEKMGRLENALTQVRGKIDRGELQSVSQARVDLETVDGGDDHRAFFRVKLLFDDHEQLRN